MNELSPSRLPVDESEVDFVRNPGEFGGEVAQQTPLLVTYLRIAKRRRWLILSVVAVCLVLGLVATLLMTPLYTASATLEIQRESANIVNVEGVEPKTGSVDQEFYQTQYGLLQSRSLAERVARELRLYNSPEFFEAFGATERVDELRAGRIDNSAAVRDARIRAAGTILLDGIEISPIRLSRLVDVEFTSPDPQLSARIVNAWTEKFIETTLERRFDATSYARNFLEERLEQLRQRLEQSERVLVDYASRENIINIPTGGSTAEGAPVERPIAAENLATLNQALAVATAERVEAQSRVRGTGGSTVEALQSQVISNLRQRRAEANSEYVRLLSQFEPEYPQAQALQRQIAELDSVIAREEARVRNTLEESYRSAAARESALQARVQRLRDELLNVRGRSIQYNIYQREVDTNRQLYDALLQRYKEIGVAGGVGVNNVAVVDAADTPTNPSSPNLILNVLISLMVGAVLGAGLALALEQIDEAISTPTDLERTVGLPLLGTIPKVAENPQAEIEDPKSPLVEAYLSVQTRLNFATDHGIPRSLVVTSTRPAEGKSTTTYALARLLARTGRKIVLIDGDMRAPSLHGFFDVKNERGLSNFLAGSDDLASLIHDDTARGIGLMPAGPLPPNAAELLTGNRLERLLEELGRIYDNVLIDAPPVMGLADTPLIASRADGTVFVIESHATRSSTARVAIGRLRDAHVRLLGAVLTKFESRRADYGYGYEYGYGYGESAREGA